VQIHRSIRLKLEVLELEVLELVVVEQALEVVELVEWWWSILWSWSSWRR
jgi:hypothetical protein